MPGGSTHEAPQPRILLVGGIDPSGGAGLTVDADTARALGAVPVPVATAHTDQDDAAVRSVGPVPPEEWLATATAELEAGPSDAPLAALKFGLLPGRDHVLAAAELVTRARAALPGLPVVLDPVLASSSGYTFLDGQARAALKATLLPLAVVPTPNVPEAAALTGRDPSALADDPDERLAAARDLLALGAAAVVLKGGHARGPQARDVVLEAPSRAGAAPPAAHWIEHPRIPGPGIRGSGCRHATALAVSLARGLPPAVAARAAATHVAAAIRAAHP